MVARPTAAVARSILKPHAPRIKRGQLVACEGLDASGKTTVMELLQAELRARDVETVLSNWNDTVEMYNLMMKMNLEVGLSSETRCVLGAAELAARYHYALHPALERGAVVLANKYLVSAMAHSVLRGHSRQFVDSLYEFALRPDITFYFDIPVELALERKRPTGIGFWEAGLDVAERMPLAHAVERYSNGEFDDDFVVSSFRSFQTRLRHEHVVELERYSPVIWLDGTRQPRELVTQCLDSLEIMRYRRLCEEDLHPEKGTEYENLPRI